EMVSCVVMEPIQGEGGFIIPPKKFVQSVSEFCKKHGILFVADEIQTGMGRTGKLFATEHFEVEPDLMTISKSLAAGLPLRDRKSTRLNSSHVSISYAVFCLKKKKKYYKQ